MFGEYLAAVEGTEIFAGVCISLMGCRRSEVCGLLWSDFDWTKGNGYFGRAHIERTYHRLKGGKKVEQPCKTESSVRDVLLPDWIGEQLFPLRSFGAIMKNRDGSRMTPDRYTDLWAKYLKAAGLPHVPLKNVRHSFGTYLASMNVNPYFIKEAMGHDDIRTTTEFYLQSTDAPLIAAAQTMGEIVKLHSENAV